MKKTLFNSLFFIALIALFATTSCQKDEYVEPQPKISGIDLSIPRITVENGQLIIYLSVTDKEGNPITDITSNNIKVEKIQDGISTQIGNIDLFSSGTGHAFDIASALTMDYSGSMYADNNDIQEMETAVKNFIGMKSITDLVEIIKFSANVYTIAPFTTDTTVLYDAIEDTTYPLMASTAYYKACQIGISDAAAVANASPAQIMPAVIGFTDGENNMAPLNPDSVIIDALQSQIPIYTIGYGTVPDTATLHHIADTTGGRFFFAPTNTDIQTLYQYVNGQLSSLYQISFPFGSKQNAEIRVSVYYKSFLVSKSKLIWY